ncbi:epidermal growth factor receptor-like isoform X1 [Apostichopus japonicus]|uniref:epidermal growth factor receptor-like isoform X1 n=1 Tax=Stichopus japonicus TaxID=307972 RepID=UPI003AB72DCB
MASLKVFIFNFSSLLIYFHLRLTDAERITCKGTNIETGGYWPPLNELERRYQYCTHVEGNLELIDIQPIPGENSYSSSSFSGASSIQSDEDEYIDLSFLEQIREISGYLLIRDVQRSFVPLRNLRIIRGEETLNGDALVIITASTRRDDAYQLSSLQEISQGGVRIDPVNLCYIETINWEDLQRDLQLTGDSNGEQCAISCDESCEAGCWDEGPDHCQKQTLTNCDSSCPYRCRGPGPEDCCHEQCAGGCTGDSNIDCKSCRFLTNGDECVSACPPKKIYNPATFLTEINPEFRYEHKGQCLKSCPASLVGQDKFCVEECSYNYQNIDGECIQCDGICPKDCAGLSLNDPLTVAHMDEDKFLNCTRIVGNVLINEESFKDKLPDEVVGITAAHLEVFRSVTEITGYLVLTLDTPNHNLIDLTIFENLEQIGGAENSLHEGSLYAFILNIPLLEIADFSSLKSVNGDIFYVDTCYHTREMFLELLSDPAQHEVVEHPTKTQCGTSLCDEECTDIGCWGPSAGQCFTCRHYALEDGTCVPPCDPENHFIIQPTDDGGIRTCGLCDEQCTGGCTGPSNADCISCRNFQIGSHCTNECNDGQYPVGKICELCPDFCTQGCTGNEHMIGDGGCNQCSIVLIDHDENFMRCLDSLDSCDVDHLQVNSNMYPNSSVCQKCHPECEGGCERAGDSTGCRLCKRHTRGIYCVEQCSSSEYPDADKICRNCDPTCLHCNNGTDTDCTKCENLEVLLEDDKRKCVTECPVEFPYMLETYTCVAACPENSFKSEDNICKSCHPECNEGCHNETNKGCLVCEHVKLDGACVAECPDSHEDTNGVCEMSKRFEASPASSPLKVLILITILVLVVVLVVAIVIVVLKLKGPIHRAPNAMYLNDMTKTEESDRDDGGNGIA